MWTRLSPEFYPPFGPAVQSFEAEIRINVTLAPVAKKAYKRLSEGIYRTARGRGARLVIESDAEVTYEAPAVRIFNYIQNAREEVVLSLRPTDVDNGGLLEPVLEEADDTLARVVVQRAPRASSITTQRGLRSKRRVKTKHCCSSSVSSLSKRAMCGRAKKTNGSSRRTGAQRRCSSV
jgi:hypothetical protein